MNTIVVKAAADQYEGDPAFTVTVDNVQVGGPYYVSTLYSTGTFQEFDVVGSYNLTNSSVVAVNYVNDASGATGDRNLYVGSVTINGTTLQGSVAALGANGVLPDAGALWSNGSLSFRPPGPTPSSTGGLAYVGVNLSGAEVTNGAYSPATSTIGVDYSYPTYAELQYYAGKGLNVIRLPIQWERVQPTLDGPLNTADMAQIKQVVGEAKSLGMTVDLDLHNYGSYNGSPIGSAAVPIGAFDNFWSAVATQFAGNPNVMFGLMNEPNLPSATWLAAANGAIQAIRDAGATSQKILVSGIDYDTASTWLSSGNAAAYGNAIVDPSNNHAFEVHQYFDSDGSGVGGDTVSATIGPQDLQAITQWAQQNGQQLFLGEFGANSDTLALTNLRNTLAYMAANSGVWLGGTEWEASTRYSYYFNVAPVNGVDSPQIGVLDQFTPGTTAVATPATPPTVGGVAVSTTLTDEATGHPFAGLGITDTSPHASDTAIITLTSAGVATDLNGVLSGAGLTHTGAGSYSIAATDPATLASELAAMLFDPATHQAAVGATVFTTLSLAVSNAVGAASTSTVVAATAVPTAPTITGISPITTPTGIARAAPFPSIVVTDPDVAPAVSATISLTINGKTADSNGLLTGNGLIHTSPGTYALAAIDPASLTAELQSLAFIPTPQPVVVTTGVSLTVTEGTATANASTSIVTPAAGSVSSITVGLAEDAYSGDATALITIDGVQVGGLQTVTAPHSGGHYDTFTFTGDFGVGAQTIAVQFTNDAYGGSSSQDRNLYVTSVALNGTVQPNTSAPLYSNGAVSFHLASAASPSGLVAPTLANSSSIVETIMAH